jgi:hypothetical protein
LSPKDLGAPRDALAFFCERLNSRDWRASLFHFFMRRMLPAAPAKLLQLDPVRRRLPVLRGRVVPLFALTALHRNDFSGH